MTADESISPTGSLKALLVGLLAAIALIAAGCGAASTRTAQSDVRRVPPTPTTHAELKRFLAPASFAFAVFQRDVYQPFKRGDLKGTTRHRQALKKAAAATAVTAQEVALAKEAAASSTALRKLYAPLASLQPVLGVLSSNFSRGRLDAGDINLVNRTIASLKKIGSATGMGIRSQLEPTQ